MVVIAFWALLKKYPLASDDMGDREPGTIQGSSWYVIVIMTLHPECYLSNTLGVDNVAICYEQFSRKDRGKFVAWPFDVLDAKVVTGAAGLDLPRTFEPWVPHEEQRELYEQLEGGYEAEDFGDDNDGNGEPLQGPFNDAASSAETSVDGGGPPPPAVFDPWQGHW